MRQGLSRAAVIAFLVLGSVVGLSQTIPVGATLCGPLSPKAVCDGAAATRRLGYFTQGPLYNPTFAYRGSSLSFTIPAMVWSALGKAVYAPSVSETVAPDTTTYWYLQVSQSSQRIRSGVRGSYVSSTSAAPGPNQVLEYTVVSDRSGISSVTFPMPAQLLSREAAEELLNHPIEPNGGTALLAVVEQGAQVDGSGDGFFNGAVQANAGATPSAVFTPLYYGNVVVAQTTSAPTAQPGFISVVNGIAAGTGQPAPVYTSGQITAGAGQVTPAFQNGQVAVGFPYTGSGNGNGLTGLFTAGTAGNIPNTGSGVITWGNATGTNSWTQFGSSGNHLDSGVYSTVLGLLEVNGVTPAINGCSFDAEANWGCSGSLNGNAFATPVPSGAKPAPTSYPTGYGGPAVIAQATSAPTAQPGNVLVGGTSAAVSHNVCSASSGVPCEFTWSITSFSSGKGNVGVTVPASSICIVTATQTPIVGSSDVMASWVTGPALAILTVHAQDLLGTYSGSFGGNGNCD